MTQTPGLFIVTPGRRALVAALIVNLVAIGPLFLTGAMSVQIARDFGTHATTVGALAAAFALSTTLSTAFAGRNVRRFGIQRSMRVSSVVAIISLTGAALSPNTLLLAVALVIGGMGNALAQPAGNALVASQVSQRRFGLGFAIKQSAIPLATTLSGLAVPLIAVTIGWRFAYASAAVVALLTVFLAPKDQQRNVGRTEATVPRKQVVPLWIYALGIGLIVAAATSIGTLGTAGGVAVDLSESTAGYLVAAGGFAGLTIRLFAGWCADRYTFDAMYGIVVLAVLGGLGWIAMGTQAVTMFIIGLIVANAFGWGWPGLQHLSIARRFPTSTAAASGISQTGVSAGLLIGPLVLALLARNSGWASAWFTAAGCAFLGAAIIFWVSYRLPPEEPRPQTG